MTKATIIIVFVLEGFHHFPDAPEEVSFLRSRHRHLFHFKLHFDVSHDNRQLEFFIVRKQAIEAITRVWGGEHGRVSNATPLEFGDMSCEMIARAILNDVFIANATDPFKVEVWEDGENGAIVERIYDH